MNTTPHDLFDIKNDRRLSMYLYRMGFAVWLLYLVLGGRFVALAPYFYYRTDVGIAAAMFMQAGLFASMVYDYYHFPHEFEQKRKWLLIAYVLIAVLVVTITKS